MIRIYVIGIHGYGVDYGCCDIFSNQEYYEVTTDKLGSILYDILKSHPFTEYKIILEYNTDTSALPRNGEDIVRSTNNKGNSRNTEIKSSVV